MSSELFQMIGHALAPLSAQADMKLHWTQLPMNDCGWCLHLGYSRSGDPFDDGTVGVERIILNTGQRDINLQPAELDADTWNACGDQCLTDWQTEVQS